MAANSSAHAFSASFTWSGIGACGGTSPAFTIRSAPKGTASLRFAMRDYDAPNFRHGGSTVGYDGKGRVAQGAISYVGPCPPPGQTHRYIWTIEAVDGSGKVLGQAEAEGRFPLR
ncbi:MAG TPA: phospholipid-binding protein [Bosea sp. (in: a-proteobacteria)]|jgi:hypothetical protein|uniref:phospholipid-binding protein n=1 Tax=Bosea sp. (in: a-proteobacteria) TaxID=1871050 RepID=UPI002E0E82F9|nr:phospholipid-binding protein [Bosea sp. (in: a-proteobacteria)]